MLSELTAILIRLFPLKPSSKNFIFDRLILKKESQKRLKSKKETAIVATTAKKCVPHNNLVSSKQFPSMAMR